MSQGEKKSKRERAIYKMGNQIAVLGRTGTTKQKPVIAEIAKLYATL